MNHSLSIEYDDSDQEMPIELVETDSIGNGVLVRQEIIALFQLRPYKLNYLFLIHIFVGNRGG